MGCHLERLYFVFLNNLLILFCSCCCHQKSERCDQVYKEVYRGKEQEHSTLCCYGELFCTKAGLLSPDSPSAVALQVARLNTGTHSLYLFIDHSGIIRER